MFVLPFALVAIAVVPYAPAVEERADLVEWNRCHDDEGCLRFHQVIFYEWCDADGRYHVRDYRLFQDRACFTVHQDRGGAIVIWREQGFARRLRAPWYRDTWTIGDPEVAERAFRPVHERRTLWEPK